MSNKNINFKNTFKLDNNTINNNANTNNINNNSNNHSNISFNSTAANNNIIPISPVDDYDLDTFDEINLYPLQDENEQDDDNPLNTSYSSFPPLYVSDPITVLNLDNIENENRSSSPINSIAKNTATKRATTSLSHTPTAQTIASLNKRVNKSEKLPYAS